MWKLAERLRLQAIFVETQTVDPGFETEHPFEKVRDEYEREELMSGRTVLFDDFAETRGFPSDRKSVV